MENAINEQTLIVMCGLPGSGKSKWAEFYSEVHPDFKVVSTDAIRKEMFGSEEEQKDGWFVFLTAYERLLKIIKSGGNAIFDATNLKRKDRKKIIKFFSKYENLSLHLVWMDTPIEICKIRDRQRERHVGEDIIDKMKQSFTEPDYSEGWDEIVFNKVIL